MKNTQYHLKYKNIKPATINAVKKTIKKGLFKKENTRLFKELLVQDLHFNLCEIYNLNYKELNFVKTEICICNYNHINEQITLNKPSLISYLHEFKHFLDIKTKGITNEKNARSFSISLFYLASPNLFKNAVEKGLIIHQKEI